MKTVEEYMQDFEKMLENTDFSVIEEKYCKTYENPEMAWSLAMFILGYEQCRHEWLTQFTGTYEADMAEQEDWPLGSKYD